MNCIIEKDGENTKFALGAYCREVLGITNTEDLQELPLISRMPEMMSDLKARYHVSPQALILMKALLNAYDSSIGDSLTERGI